MTARAAFLLAAGGLLVAARLALPLAAPPLYDGLGLPPEKYRYLQPPPNLKQVNKHPTSVHLAIPLEQGKMPEASLGTNEQPPQATLLLDYDALRVPAGAKEITLAIAPISPPAQPADGTIDGNVYRFTATANNGAQSTLKPGAGAHVELRGTGQIGSPIIEQYKGGRWVRLPTGRFFGVAIYTTKVTSLGDFTLVLKGKTAGGSSGTSLFPFILIGGSIIVLVVLLLVLLRLSRREAGDEDDVEQEGLEVES